MKKLLLDSHTLLWFFEEDPKLPNLVKDLIEDRDTFVAVSIVSFWELSIKQSIGKLKLAKSIAEMFHECEKQDISIIPISQQEIIEIGNLPFKHRDPFDRMIIATAQINALEILSADIEFDAYPISRIW
jgi:PIN domain nuclease of toxin-antitoxin system